MSNEEQPLDSPTPTGASSARSVPRPRRGRGRRATASRKSSARTAANWVLGIAILQLVIGTFFGFQNAEVANEGLEALSAYDAAEVLTLEGESHTVAEWREMIERERVQGFAIPIGLAVAFFALYFWARKSALPALITALCLFVGAHALEAVADPKTLARGLIIKVLFLAAMGRGIKGALEERAMEQQEALANGGRRAELDE